MERYRVLFELAYRDFHSREHRNLDPISLVHPFKDPKDQEIVAFFAALLSYGNVKSIISSIHKVLAPMQPSPYRFLMENQQFNVWNSFTHRFTKGSDIEMVAHWASSAIKTFGSLEGFFKFHAPLEADCTRLRLSAFVKAFTSQSLPNKLKSLRKQRSRNLKYLISDPEQGSACKRLNMFLRWVVRPNDGVDLGLWTTVKPSALMLPLDTHLLQTLQKLRWTRSKNASWKVVEKATLNLRKIHPVDPIRYDFALCHLSMSGKNISQLLKESNAQVE